MTGRRVMKGNEIGPYSSATEMLAALESGGVSSVELLELHLKRIEKLNPALNAIVTPDFENARKTAAEADAGQARDETAPLLGLPMTIKDCIDVKGLRGTAGLEAHRERKPEADAPVTASVRAAGAVIMGKTNVPPNAADWQSNNPVFGRTNNPWDLSRTPGGSTGGGAASLAAGLTPLELGSDVGGSIRIPAAFCGVYGHKPSETAVPKSGHFPGFPRPNPGVTMLVLGPLARSAQDLELALDVVAGPDVGEDVGWRLQIPPARHDRLSEYRVAVLPAINWLPVDSEIQESLEGLAGALGRAGARVEEAQPEGFGDMRRHHELYTSTLSRISSLRETEARRTRMAESMRSRGGMFGEAMARGMGATASGYVSWLSAREGFREAYREFFRGWDVLLAPITVVPPFPHTDARWPERRLDVNNESVEYGLQTVYPGVATFCGQPATAFPWGQTRSGLPIGLQAIGPYLEDRTSIRFAELVSREFGGFQAPPGYGGGW